MCISGLTVYVDAQRPVVGLLPNRLALRHDNFIGYRNNLVGCRFVCLLYVWHPAEEAVPADVVGCRI